MPPPSLRHRFVDRQGEGLKLEMLRAEVEVVLKKNLSCLVGCGKVRGVLFVFFSHVYGVKGEEEGCGFFSLKCQFAWDAPLDPEERLS
ncbi:hypothetical protein TNCV_82941 [Trichonephila clavipes]|nr:hypothetical protein TNCV_82941 [Trichonephila clavipes]